MVYFLCKAYDSDRQNCYFALSLPVRGAWVEILSILTLNSLSLGFSALGRPTRGLTVSPPLRHDAIIIYVATKIKTLFEKP